MVTSPSRLAPARVDGTISNSAYSGIERHRPPVTRTEHVPRTQDGRRQTRVCDGRFPRGAHLDVGAHDRGGMRDADVDEMRDTRGRGRRHRGLNRRQIDAAKLSRLRGRRMRRSHEVHERLILGERAGVGIRVERVADHRLGTGRHTPHRLRPRQHAYTMAPRQQGRGQSLPDVTRAASDENGPTYGLFHFSPSLRICTLSLNFRLFL